MMKYFLKRELWFCLHDSGCAITESLLEREALRKIVFFSGIFPTTMDPTPPPPQYI